MFRRNSWVVALLAAVTAGCGSNRPMQIIGDWFSDAREVQVEEYGRALNCGTAGKQMTVSLFPNVARFEDWREARGVQMPGFEQASDQQIVVIEYGQRPTTGYHLAVSRVARARGSELTLNVTLLSPPPGAVTAQMLTAPCVVVGVPRGNYRLVRVVDQSGQERAQWRD